MKEKPTEQTKWKGKVLRFSRRRMDQKHCPFHHHQCLSCSKSALDFDRTEKHVLVEANLCEFNFQLDPATCAISFQLLKQVQTVLMAMEARENVVRPRTIVIATGS